MTTLKERFKKVTAVNDVDYHSTTILRGFFHKELLALAEEYEKQATEYDTAGKQHADGVAYGFREAAALIRSKANELI